MSHILQMNTLASLWVNPIAIGCDAVADQRISKFFFAVIIAAVVGFSTTSCSHSNKLAVAFTRVDQLMKGSEVRVAGLPIGYVADFKQDKNLDTIFVILKITHKIRVPKGSQFYVDENLLGSSFINVEYSKNETYLNSKDISIGIFRPFQRRNSFQVDSAKQRLSLKLAPPKIDSVKNR